MSRVLQVVLAMCVGLTGCQASIERRSSPSDAVSLYRWPAGDVDAATKVSVKRSDAQILVRWDCVDDFISTPVAGRDTDLYKGDVVELFIDPAGAGREIVEIQVNPNNDVLDLLLKYHVDRELTEGGRLTESSVSAHFGSDRTFNLGGLKTSAGRTSTGYWVELRIPMQSLHRAVGLSRTDPRAMRWNLVRLDRQHDGRVVQSSVVQVDPGCQHISPDRTAFSFR